MEKSGEASVEDVSLTNVPAESGELAPAEAPGDEVPAGDAALAEQPSLGGLDGRSVAVDGQQMVGARWGEAGIDRVEIRTLNAEGTWSDWQIGEIALSDDGPSTGIEPLWIGDASEVQVRASRDGADATADLELVLIGTPVGESVDATGAGAPAGSFAPALPMAPTSTGIAAPSVVPRAGWGANESLTSGTPKYADHLDAVVVHHTAGTNNYSESEAPAYIRGMLAYHTQTLGWKDIGYNALVDKYGNVYEGRAGGLNRAVVGAHAVGSNTGTFGITIMGDLSNTKPTQAALDAVADLSAWKLGGSFHFDANSKVAVNGKEQFRVFGHRDAAGNATACPGDLGYAELGSLRNAINTRTAESKTPLWQFYQDNGGEAEFGDVTEREHLSGNERVIEFSSGKSLHQLPDGTIEVREDGNVIDEGVAPEAPETTWQVADFGSVTLHKAGPDGTHVQNLQEALNELGASLTVDGKFGGGTDTAVRDFQRSAGITVDGRVGGGTKQALVDALTAGGGSAPAPAPTPGATPSEGEWTSGDFGSSTLYRGKSGSAVELLQNALNEYGYALEIDGKFGQGTERAVKAFQLDQGLAADGRVGAKTKAELVTEMNGLVSSSNPAAATPADSWHVADFGSSTLYRGVRGGAVPELQRALNELGQDLAVDGSFGRQTGDAVVDFQRAQGLATDGRVGGATKAALIAELNA